MLTVFEFFMKKIMPIINQTNTSELEEKLKIVVLFQEQYNYSDLLTWLLANYKIVLSYLCNDQNLNINPVLPDLNELFLDTDLDDYRWGPNFQYFVSVPDPGCLYNHKGKFSLQKQPDFFSS